MQLSEMSDASSFMKLIESDEHGFWFSCGVNKPLSRLHYSEKEKVVNAMCLHYSVLTSLAEMEQLRRGLAVQNFNILMESHPQAIRKAFEPSEIQVTSDFLQDFFVPVFSAQGSNKRGIEEALIMSWIHYLQSIEGRNLCISFVNVMHYLWLISPEGKSSPTLTDVMVFLTGCNSMPPMGFGDVSLTIVFSDDGVLPTVSTCSLTLTIPRKFPTDLDLFKEKMDFSILGSHRFFLEQFE